MRRLTFPNRRMSFAILMILVICSIITFLYTQWVVNSWTSMKNIRSVLKKITSIKSLKSIDFQPLKKPHKAYRKVNALNHHTRMLEYWEVVHRIPSDKRGHDNLKKKYFIKVPSAHHVGNPAMHILSAFGSEPANHHEYATSIKLNGWVYRRRLDHPIKCCILWRDNNVTMVSSPNIVRLMTRNVALLSSQISCPFDYSLHNVTGVTVQFTNKLCPAKYDELYVKPTIPAATVDKESFALCLKIVYGNIDNAQLIDWLEFHREIKVDKVFMFTYNVTEATHNVIKHYVDMGFVESRYLDYPFELRKFDLGDKNPSVWEIKRTVIYDCFQRAAGYKYMAVVDMDEFLLPRRHGHVKELMKHVMKLHPDAAGFRLPTCIFDKNLQPDSSAPINATDVMKYFRRTPPSYTARAKSIILPSRTSTEGLYTHDFKPNEHYKREYMEFSDATINHYRRCYSNLEDTLCSARGIQEDRYILKFMEKLKNRDLGNW